MQAVLTVAAAIGSIGIFMAGFIQLTGASMRLIGPWFRAGVTDRHASAGDRLLLGVGGGAGGSGVSAVVSLLSLVDGGALEARHTPWILLGINLGATAACWIVALGGFRTTLAPLALLLFACALPFRRSATLGRYTHPDVLSGLALLMLGIDLITARVVVIADAPQLMRVLQRLFESGAAPLVGFGLGVVISALLRSSVGTVVLAMSLMIRGWLPFNPAAAMVLGGNAGVALTGYLAAGGLAADARRTAMIHLLISSLACVWAALAFSPLLSITGALFVGTPSATVAAARLALFHSLVHAVNPLLFLLSKRVILTVAERLVPCEAAFAHGENNSYSLALLPPTYPEALDANLIRLRSGLARMAELAYEMLMIVINTSQLGDSAAEQTERVVGLRFSTKQLEEEISAALTSSVQLPCSRTQAERIQQQQRTAQQVSLISDDCYKTMRLLELSYRKNYRFHQQSRDELFDFTSQILDFLKYNSDYLAGNIDTPNWDVANRMEDTIDEVRDKLKRRVSEVLRNNEEADIKAELAFIDIVSHLEHVGDRCLNISDSVRKLTPRRRLLRKGPASG